MTNLYPLVFPAALEKHEIRPVVEAMSRVLVRLPEEDQLEAAAPLSDLIMSSRISLFDVDADLGVLNRKDRRFHLAKTLTLARRVGGASALMVVTSTRHYAVKDNAATPWLVDHDVVAAKNIPVSSMRVEKTAMANVADMQFTAIGTGVLATTVWYTDGKMMLANANGDPGDVYVASALDTVMYPKGTYAIHASEDVGSVAARTASLDALARTLFPVLDK